MSGTRIVAVRQAVIDGLDALTAFDGARVSLTWNSEATEREQVFTTRARFTHKPASMKAGRTFRDEDGSFELVIDVQKPGSSADDTATRAVVLGIAAEEWIADNRSTLGVAGVNWVTVDGDGDLLELYNDAATTAVLRYRVTYNARLT